MVSAQTCPAANTLNTAVTSTPNTCSSNGSITITMNSGSSLSLELQKNGAIQTVVNPSSNSYIFNNLPAGNYQILVKCKSNNSLYETKNITVVEQYSPITDANITISNVCTNFQAGGTFTVSGVTGGNGPYTYSYVLSNDPSYPDSSSNYTSSNTYNATQFGTYQIRVKDNCNNYQTFTKTIGPNVVGIRYYWKSKYICNTSPRKVTASYWYALDSSDAAVDINNFGTTGLKIVVRDTNPTGAILYNGTISFANPTFDYVESSSHQYYVTTTNACGIQESYYHMLLESENNAEFYYVKADALSSGCGASERMTISGNTFDINYWTFPLTVQIKNSSNSTVFTQSNIVEDSSWEATNLPLGNYTVTVTDACGNSLNKSITNPQNSGTPTVNINAYTAWRCYEIPPLTQTGTVQVQIEITGYIQDRPNAVVKIVSGPSNVGVNGSIVNSKYWAWSNMLPGTYTISITSCNSVITKQFTVDDSSLLKQGLTSTAESFCSGGGNIISNKIYNGSYDNVVELLNSSGAIIATSGDGYFYNIPVGNYKTRFKIIPSCNSGAYTYYIPGNDVIISNSSTGPRITTKLGVICESSTGQPLTTGNAYVTLTGVAPYKLSYKLSSTSTWTVINNAPIDNVIQNLNANSTYDLKLEDGCGGSYSDQITIGTVASLTSETTMQPCYNQPYNLQIQNYSGASYEWTNSQNIIVSNTRTYSIANYDSTYDGTYVCKVTWGNCVTRYITVRINGALCGNTITDACYKDPGTTKPVLSTNNGITALSRAGADNGNWPMVRKGAHTVLESKTKGFVINRLTTSQKSALIPVLGMMVYDTDLNCLSIYTGSDWKCFNTQSCPN